MVGLNKKEISVLVWRKPFFISNNKRGRKIIKSPPIK